MATGWRHWMLAVCLGVSGLVGVAGAEEKKAPVGFGALDQQMADTLKEIHNRGADLYNNGDAAGCYRIFQGALMTVRPLLGHHEKVQKAIETGLSEAEANPDVKRRAFALHRLIEEVRQEIKPAARAK